MRPLNGTGAGSGIVVGAARLLPPRIQVAERSIAAEHIVAELQRFEGALASADAALANIALRGFFKTDLINHFGSSRQGLNQKTKNLRESI